VQVSEAIRKFFKAAKETKSSQNTKLLTLMFGALSSCICAMSVAQMQEMNGLLKKIKNLLLLKEVAAIKPAIGKLDREHITEETPIQEKDETRDAMFLGLEKLTTSKMCPILKKRLFLLHRPTVDFEYDQSKRASKVQSAEPQEVEHSQGADNTDTYPDYETNKDTKWLVDSIVAERHRNGKNPIVSAWIPETYIQDVKGSQQGVGAWGEMGANENKDIITVIVKPGVYKIYSELKD
jgi:hypothetical protein